jgi:hypothetical protein
MTGTTDIVVSDPREAAAAAMAEGLASTLRLARAMAGAGREVDLAGIDGGIGQLCARCLDLPPERGRAMRPVLASLLADLDSLAAALQPGQPP